MHLKYKIESYMVIFLILVTIIALFYAISLNNSHSRTDKIANLINDLRNRNRLSTSEVYEKEGIIYFSSDTYGKKIGFELFGSILKNDANILKISSPAFNLRKLLNIPDLRYLYIQKAGTSDYDFQSLQEFRNLKTLELLNINEQEINSLPLLSSLNNLTISANNQVNIDCNFFKRFPSLQTLKIENIALSASMGQIVLAKNFSLTLEGNYTTTSFSFLSSMNSINLYIENATVDIADIGKNYWNHSIKSIHFSNTDVLNADVLTLLDPKSTIIIDSKFHFANKELFIKNFIGETTNVTNQKSEQPGRPK